jgi:UDP-N-acetylmuramoylalanine--D-glutamate ligase
LIAGGRDKQMNFEKTMQLVKNNIKIAVLIGESAYKLNRLWKKSTSCLICSSFSEAIEFAVSQVEPGDILLLSPGCASQDMFRNYKARGEQFREQILRS